MTRMIIIGSRSFDDYSFLTNKVNEVIEDLKIDLSSLEIVSGGDQGADFLAEKYAKDNNLPCRIFHSDWSNLNVYGADVRQGQFGPYNKNAARDRNKLMRDYASQNNGILVAFWNGSSGTKQMIGLARLARLNVFVFKF